MHARLVLAVLFVVSFQSAFAVPITFSFTGSVTDDPFGLSSFGAPISGSYTFSTTAADSIPALTTGSFPSIGPAFGFDASVDGTPYSVAGNLTVNTANNIGVDQYGAIATDGTLTLELFFEDPSQTALSSDALPLLPPPVVSFAIREFRLFSPDAEFLGTIDSLVCSAGCNGVAPGPGNGVPEPASMWLIAAGMLSFALRRKNTQYSRSQHA